MSLTQSTEPIRNIACDMVRPLHELCTERFPMFPDYIPAMIRRGMYIVIDSHGKRMPTEQALEIIKNDTE